MSLKNQKRMAATVLGIGKNRVWINPDKSERVGAAITREDIKSLIHERAIGRQPKKGVSRGRARILHAKRKEGRRRGTGSREGCKGAHLSRKSKWITKIRALRRKLRKLREERTITPTVY
ncbi:MAG: 50S ribosomal protein L19e, partial [Candidatus Bathyarchaeota archaeon]